MVLNSVGIKKVISVGHILFHPPPSFIYFQFLISVLQYTSAISNLIKICYINEIIEKTLAPLLLSKSSARNNYRFRKQLVKLVFKESRI